MHEYPHMCRMGHVEIGHADSEHEGCPLCRKRGELKQLKRQLEAGAPLIEVRQQDWMAGFAGFVVGSMETEGPAHIALNLGALIAAVETGDLDPEDLPYVVAESIMHEVVHALEEWAGAEFSEERVRALIEDYRREWV